MVCFAMDKSIFDAARSQPHRKTITAVTAVVVAFLCWSAFQFGRPGNECFVQHGACLQVFDQAGGKLTDGFGQSGLFLHFSVEIPVQA